MSHNHQSEQEHHVGKGAHWNIRLIVCNPGPVTLASFGILGHDPLVIWSQSCSLYHVKLIDYLLLSTMSLFFFKYP